MEKITILNGSPDTKDCQLDSYLEELTKSLESRGCKVDSFQLRRMNIRYCTGCFGCWVKTPGECVIKDDSAGICRSSVNSDFLLFASPVIMGFTSATLKRACDRLIPLLHPYFDTVEGEVHHRRRYPVYPKLGLIIEKTPDTDTEDIRIIETIYRRMAVNLRSEFSLFKSTDDKTGEVADAINSL